MTRKLDYAIARVNDETYRLDRRDGPFPGPVAFIISVRDRADHPIGWRLRPLKVTRAPRSGLWPTPAEAIGATRLMTPAQAKAEIDRIAVATRKSSRNDRPVRESGFFNQRISQ